MATYRIYYVERAPSGGGIATIDSMVRGAFEYEGESEWEETYDGRNAGEALEGFFRDHAGDRGNVRIIEEDGAPREIGGAGFDPDRTYIWVEEGKLMEYQGLDEATPGMVACPLCDGTGEVDEATAEDFADQWQSDEDEEE